MGELHWRTTAGWPQGSLVNLFPPGFEPGTFRVLGERDNHYTTETGAAEIICTLTHQVCNKPLHVQLQLMSQRSETKEPGVGSQQQKSTLQTVIYGECLHSSLKLLNSLVFEGITFNSAHIQKTPLHWPGIGPGQARILPLNHQRMLQGPLECLPKSKEAV